MYDLVFEITVIRCEAGSCGPESKYRIFHYRYAFSYALKKMTEVFEDLIAEARAELEQSRVPSQVTEMSAAAGAAMHAAESATPETQGPGDGTR